MRETRGNERERERARMIRKRADDVERVME